MDEKRTFRTGVVGCLGLSEDEMAAVKIHAPWDVDYDLEQILEHTIVHVLRHRRQIERWSPPSVPP